MGGKPAAEKKKVINKIKQSIFELASSGGLNKKKKKWNDASIDMELANCLSATVAKLNST